MWKYSSHLENTQENTRHTLGSFHCGCCLHSHLIWSGYLDALACLVPCRFRVLGFCLFSWSVQLDVLDVVHPAVIVFSSLLIISWWPRVFGWNSWCGWFLESCLADWSCCFRFDLWCSDSVLDLSMCSMSRFVAWRPGHVAVGFDLWCSCGVRDLLSPFWGFAAASWWELHAFLGHVLLPSSD